MEGFTCQSALWVELHMVQLQHNLCGRRRPPNKCEWHICIDILWKCQIWDFKIRTNIGKLSWRKAKIAIRWVLAWGAWVVMAAPVKWWNVCWYSARDNVTWQTIYCFFEITLLNLFLDNTRPGNARAAAKGTKGGDQGRKHLGGPVIHAFQATNFVEFVLKFNDLEILFCNAFITWDHFRDLPKASMFSQLPEKAEADESIQWQCLCLH